MNRNLVNSLFLPVLVSGITVVSSTNFASAQSANSCDRYLSNMNVMGSDFYERMNAYQKCASQWINSLPKQPSQNYPQYRQPHYNPNNDQIYRNQQQLMQQMYEMKSRSLQDTACMPYCN